MAADIGASTSSSIRKSRKSNFSTDEIDTLVSMVKKHYKTLYGKFAKRASNKNTRQKAWLDILRKVNGVSVERRTLQEVKNKWKKCQSILKENGTYSLLSSGNNDDDPDSMPLMERILKPNESQQQQQQKAQVLKSQPLSPTKLKVTRQGTKVKTITEPPPPLAPPPPPPPPPAEVTPINEEMCLRWNSHHSNMQTAFPNILMKEQYVDCTLAADGKTLKCHRMILSSCSPYFEEILSNISPLQHPIIFMKDIPFWILKSLCDFMYAGEVHIYQNKLQELLTVAEILKIKGLAGKSSNDNHESTTNPNNKITNNNNNNNNNIKDERKQKRINYHHHHHQQQFKSERLINIPPLLLSSSSSSQRGDYDNDDVLDPLDLLEPLYEEITDDKKLTTTTTTNLKLPQQQQQLLKKQLPKRIKKRRFPEQRDPSPPPVFSFRKGTRSRPNVKIPKYYHSDYDNPKPSTSLQSQQEQQQSSASSDPLLDVDEIKTEPIDVEDNNLSDFNDDTISPPLLLTPSSGIIQENLPIEISPQYHNVTTTTTTNDKFCKIKLTKQPIISNVRSIDDGDNVNDDDDNNDITTPLGGLEVIKITMDGNQQHINLAVNDDDDDDDDHNHIDHDNDGDDENSKSPQQSQINHNNNNDKMEIDVVLETDKLQENCQNNENSSQITHEDLAIGSQSHDHTNDYDHEIEKTPPPPITIEENSNKHTTVISEQQSFSDHNDDDKNDQITVN